jgi:hypothetical protein
MDDNRPSSDFLIWYQGHWPKRGANWLRLHEIFVTATGFTCSSPKQDMCRSRRDVAAFVLEGTSHPCVAIYAQYLVERLETSAYNVQRGPWIRMAFQVGHLWNMYTWNCRRVTLRLDSWNKEYTECQMMVVESVCVSRDELRKCCPSIGDKPGEHDLSGALRLNTVATARQKDMAGEDLCLLSSSGKPLQSDGTSISFLQPVPPPCE